MFLSGSYDPTKLIVTVGPLILGGFSDGDSVIARRTADNYFVRDGLDGGAARARNASKRGEFEFRLLQTSAANDELSAIFNFDDLGGDGTIVVPVAIRDGSGRSYAVATQAWIQTPPEMNFGKEINERSWILAAADMKIWIGGNPT